MSKFRRVSETQNIPSTVERAFYGNKEDMFRELRAGSQERQVKIATQTMDMRREAPVREQPWAREESQSNYIDRMMRPQDERLSNLSPADVNPNSVRRLGSTYDNGMNMRSAGQDLFVTTQDALSIIKSGASLWNPHLDEIDYMFREAQTKRDETFNEQATREFKTKQRHTDWERRNLRQRRELTTRANPIVRTSMRDEYVAETSWGIPNYNSLFDAERDRILAYEQSKAERLELKRKGFDPETRRLSWEEHAQRAAHASRFQDHQSGWMDNFTNKYRG